MRMADFKVEVPLAAGEYDDDSQYLPGESGDLMMSDLQGVVGIIDSMDNNVRNNNGLSSSSNSTSTTNGRSNGNENGVPRSNARDMRGDHQHQQQQQRKQQQQGGSPELDTFSEETMAGSLEDLVSHFDEKISHCFKNFTEETETIAPVQVRTQEEIMNESQIWWTLTGNFGNILPIDWTKTYARKLQLPALHLLPKKDDDPTSENGGTNGGANNELDLSDDEELAQALDLHSLIATSLSPPDPPPQTADQVIEEIDEIMQQSCTSELTGSSDITMESADSLCSPLKSPLPLMPTMMLQDPDLEARVRDATSLASNEDNLRKLSYKSLAALNSELESLIQIYNETLVQELALRDELEYEKEMKNAFISLLLSIQNKRRKWHIDRKRKPDKAAAGATAGNGGTGGPQQPQYLTTVIPYHEGCGAPNNGTLQSLIKILRAVNEDSPNVPNLLTEYILNVVCPSNAATPTR